jgi:hypothetical protein
MSTAPGTDKLRTAFAERMGPWEARRALVAVSRLFEASSSVEDEEFDEQLAIARDSDLDAEEADAKSSEEVEKAAATMAADPEWEANEAAAMRFGWLHGGERDPRPRCASALMLNGEHFPCEGADYHGDLAHANKKAGAIWR